MGRQRPATDTFRAIAREHLSAWTGLHSSTNKHSNVLKELATAVPGALLITHALPLACCMRCARARGGAAQLSR